MHGQDTRESTTKWVSRRKIADVENYLQSTTLQPLNSTGQTCEEPQQHVKSVGRMVAE